MTADPIFTSKDLYLSSYLQAKGLQFANATLDESGRTIFHFKNSESLNEALIAYYSGTALVNPSAFIECFKSLRALTYSMSGDLKKNMRGQSKYEKEPQG